MHRDPNTLSEATLLSLLQTALEHDEEKDVIERLQWFLHFVKYQNIKETCKHYGIARTTFYRWWNRFDVQDLKSIHNKPKTRLLSQQYLPPRTDVHTVHQCPNVDANLSDIIQKQEEHIRVITHSMDEIRSAFEKQQSCTDQPTLLHSIKQLLLHRNVITFFIILLSNLLFIYLLSKPVQADAASPLLRLLVNTETFMTIDDSDTSTDLILKFGQTLNKKLTYERSASRFSFDDDVFVSGGIEASGTVSGSIVYAGTRLSSSGTLLVESGAYIDGTTLVVNAMQDNVGIGTSSIDSDAILELDSTNKALLLTRLSDPSTDVSNAVNGMIAYDSTDNELQGYINGTWTSLAGGGGGGGVDNFDEVYAESVSDADTSMEIDDSAGLIFNITDTTVGFEIEDNSTDMIVFDAANDTIEFGDAYTINAGGITDTTYHAISDLGTADHTGTDEIEGDNDLYIEGALEVDGTVFFDSAMHLGDDSSDFAEVKATISGSLIPTADVLHDLGSDSNRWRDLYLSGGTLHLGSSGDEAEIGFDQYEGQITFDASDDNVSEMVIDDSGNVGIGTLSPGATLSVDGDAIFNESGADTDFRVEGVAEQNLLYVDASAESIGIGTDSPTHSLTVSGSSTFNINSDSGMDFVIQSDRNTAIFMVDSNQDNIGIGTDLIDASAILELDSGSQALLLTRVSDPSTDIITAVDGMIAYDSTDNQLQGYINGTWTNLAGGGGGGVDNFDEVYAESVSDFDTSMEIDDGAGLIFNITDTTVGFEIEDNSTDMIVFDAANDTIEFGNGYTINAGGITDTTYHAISDSGTASHTAVDEIEGDNDLYIEGALEVDGWVFFDGQVEHDSTVSFDGEVLSTDNAYIRITDALSIGGVSGQAYNAISDFGTATHTATDEIEGDNDLYIEGALEVDGTAFFDGNVGIGDTTPTEAELVVSGEIYQSTFSAVGSSTMCWDGDGGSKIGDCASLAQYKNDIDDLHLGLQEVLQLRPRTFTWDEEQGGEEDLGFIAEEVEAVNPLLATYRDGDLRGVKYRHMTSLLTKAVQEQHAEVQDLRHRFDEHEKGQGILLAQNIEDVLPDLFEDERASPTHADVTEHIARELRAQSDRLSSLERNGGLRDVNHIPVTNNRIIVKSGVNMLETGRIARRIIQINGGNPGDIVLLRLVRGHTPSIIMPSEYIVMKGQFELNDVHDTIVLLKSGGNEWIELMRSDG